MDDFFSSESLWVPHSHFRAIYQGAVPPVPDLECSVVVKGARKPHNKFTIDISPERKDTQVYCMSKINTKTLLYVMTAMHCTITLNQSCVEIGVIVCRS